MPTFRGESGRTGKRRAETLTLIHAFLWCFLSLGLGFFFLLIIEVVNDCLVYRDLRRQLREQKNREEATG